MPESRRALLALALRTSRAGGAHAERARQVVSFRESLAGRRPRG